MFPLMMSVFFACSESYAERMMFADTGYDDGMSGDADSDTNDSSEPPNVPTWWSLSGQLDLLKGTPLAGSTFSVMVSNADGDPLCDVPLTIGVLSATAVKPPHDSILSWWELELLGESMVCDIEVPLSSRIQLGVGSMHPDLLAALSSSDSLEPSMPLNGAYVILDESPESLFVFGVAGLPEQYTSKGTVAQEAPLTDGVWHIEPVYLFRY